LPKVSFIMPVYNCEAFLRTSVGAVLEQTIRDLELIAVDDGSTDRSPAMLEAFRIQDNRLKLLHTDHEGCSGARNAGLEAATGEWIFFVDGDDYVAPEALETLLDFHQHHDCAFSVHNYFTFAGENSGTGRRTGVLKRQPWGETRAGPDWILEAVNRKEWPHYAWLQFTRRQWIETHTFRSIPGINHQDIPWTAELALNADRVGFVDAPLYGYRHNENSLSKKPTQAALFRRARSYPVVIERLEALAAPTNRPEVRKALRRQALVESGHLMGLLRKKLQDPDDVRQVLEEVDRRQILRTAWKGVTGPRSLLKALKVTHTVRRARRRLRRSRTSNAER